MEVVPTIINALVVGLVGVAITYLTRTQIRDVRDEVKELRSEMNDRFRDQGAALAALRSEMHERFREQGSEVAALRSDLTQVALAIGARTRPQTG